MQLTKEQSQALPAKGLLRLSDPETKKEYVLLQADVYEQLIRRLLNTGEPDPDDFLPLVNEIMAEDDATDPLLESYQKYRKEPV